MTDMTDRTGTPALMARMADTLGLDLDIEREAHLVSRRQLDRAAGRCDSCADAEGCELWLDDHAGGATEAPKLCPNKALFDHLHDGW